MAITELQQDNNGELIGGYQRFELKPKNYDALLSLAKLGEAAPIWTGKFDPPRVGDIVVVAINKIGRARVLGFFKEAGFLGLLVKPLEPPSWYIKQNGKDHPCHVYGRELSEKRVMIMFLDYTQLPRAYGAAPYEVQAETVARDQLAIYCERQKQTGEIDLADPKRYTMQRTEID